MGIPRRVTVRGREGATATVVVTLYREEVWMSIVPPFTWEAIMEPGKVDELIHVLGVAREEVKRLVTVAATRDDRRSGEVIREITGSGRQAGSGAQA
jgi:hypothetical protein